MTTTDASMTRGRQHPAIQWLTAASCYFVLAAATLLLTEGGPAAPIWPANAVLLTFLLIDRRPAWTSMLGAGFIANVAAHWLMRGANAIPMIQTVANIVEVTIAAWFLRRHGGASAIASPSAPIGPFLIGCGVLAPAASALWSAASACSIFRQPFVGSFASWFISDALGLLIFTPVLLALFSGDLATCFREKSWRQRVETIALLGLTAASTAFVFFAARYPLMFALFGPVMLVTLRTGRLETKTAVMIVAVIGIFGTMHHSGPIAVLTTDGAQQAVLFRIFLVIMLLICLPVAADLAARRSLLAELAERERELVRLAATDSLTGLMSRAAFEARVTEAFRERRERFSLVAIDLDHFKQVNDRWGHQAGDRALAHAARIFLARVGPVDAVGRLGGDEFMLLLAGAGTEQAEAVCDRIRATLRNTPFPVDGGSEIRLSVSCGVATSTATQSFADLYRRADEALYLAKLSGRNTIRSVA